MNDKDLAIAYAAKRRAGVKTQNTSVAQDPDAPTSLYEAIASKFAPSTEEEPLDVEDFSLDEPELESTGNALADKIRAKLTKR